MNCLESEQYDLKLDTKLHREPMQFSQNRRYMTEPVEPTDKSTDSLQTVESTDKLLHYDDQSHHDKTDQSKPRPEVINTII